MLKRLSTAPRWVLALVTGVPFAVVMSVYAAMTLTNLTVAGRVYVGVVVGIVGGAFFGFFMGWFTERRRNDVPVRAVDEVPDALRPVVMRSAWRDPAPADPFVRHAALRVVEDSRELNHRRWRSTAVIFTCFSLFHLALALTSSRWYWLGFALFAGLLALHLAWPRRIDQRIAILSRGPFTVE